MKYCPKCRKKLIVEDFCAECGADLKHYLQNTNESNESDDNLAGFMNMDFSAFEEEAKRQFEEQKRLDQERAQERKFLEEQERKRIEEEKLLEEKKRIEKEKILEKKKQLEQEKLLEERKRIERQRRERLKKEQEETRKKEQEEAHKDELYLSAQKKMQEGSISSLEEAIKLFDGISNWRDSKDKINFCRSMIENIQRDAAVRRSKNKPRRIAFAVAFLVLARVFIYIYMNNLADIDEFGKVFQNCWVEYIFFAICALAYSAYYILSDEVFDFFAVVFLLFIIAVVVLGIICMNTMFLLRIIMVVIRVIPELIVGIIGLFTGGVIGNAVSAK